MTNCAKCSAILSESYHDCPGELVVNASGNTVIGTRYICGHCGRELAGLDVTCVCHGSPPAVYTCPACDRGGTEWRLSEIERLLREIRERLERHQ